MNFKQFSTSDNQWHDVPYYTHKTATDTLTLPATLYPNDTSITVGIKGNTTQSGTPSPSNPVDVVGTGERTAQLYDKDLPFSETGRFLKDDGTIDTSGAFNITEYIECDASTDYSLSNVNGTSNTPSVCYYDSSKNYISGKRYGGNTGVSFTTPNTCKYVRFSVRNDKLNEAMLNEGSTALPYEPYGYKIPISLSGTTNNVYLGEVETTRKIKKLVFDGTENWRESSDGNLYITLPPNQGVAWVRVLSTHFTPSQVQTNGGLLWFVNANVDFDTAEECKSYLAAQYAAGTPVTVWYVLATPQTAIVNEPLMKIDNYADSLTTSIPCAAGENTLDVQTTVHPSEVTAGFSGWHPVTDVHERESGQWD